MKVLEKILEEIESTTYPDEGIGCGLEDVGITDRYEASAYGWDKAMELVIEIIENHMEDDGWIPCSKRMPEKNTPVLVVDSQGRVCIREFIMKSKNFNEWSKGKIDVVAWQPLPKPYKGEK